MAVLVRCLLLTLCVWSVQSVVTGFTQGQQLKDTQFFKIDCDQAAGAFIITIFNGYSTPQSFILSGQCAGIRNTLVQSPTQLNAGARENVTGYLYGPATSSKSSLSIFGAQCTLSLAILQSETNNFITTQIIRQAPAVCGPFTAGTCDCAFIDLPCFWNNCDPAISAIFWWIILFGEFVIAVFAYLFWKSRSLDLQNSRHSHFRGQLILSRGTVLQKKVDALSLKVRDGSMTKDRLMADLQAANKELQDPQYMDLRRIEYINAAGKKYTGMDTECLLDDMENAVEMNTYASHATNHDTSNDGVYHVDAYAHPKYDSRARRRF